MYADMAIIYGLFLMLMLIVGGAGGWLMTTWHDEQVAAERDEDEQEMAEFRDLYAAWAILHRTRLLGRMAPRGEQPVARPCGHGGTFGTHAAETGSPSGRRGRYFPGGSRRRRPTPDSCPAPEPGREPVTLLCRRVRDCAEGARTPIPRRD
jgi:hypothetical protein